MIRAFLKRLYHSLPIVREMNDIRNRLGLLDAARQVQTSIAARQLIEWLKHTDPRYAQPERLLRHSFQVCSQNGEDGIIQEIFRRIGTTNKTFFESGVGDGMENNTAFLLSLGWTGYWVDLSPRFQNKLQTLPSETQSRLQYRRTALTRENITGLLKDLSVPRELDLLSLDIDQNTYHVWAGIDRCIAPRVVVIEYNGAIPPQVEWYVNYDANRVWDYTQNFGASLKAYEILGRKLGYTLVGCEPFGANAFFVRNDLVGDHFCAPFTAENHFEPARFHLIHRMGLPNNILDLTHAG